MKLSPEWLRIKLGESAVRLFVRRWIPADPNGCTVFCVHGITTTGADFAYLADYLAHRGYTVVSPDFAGHGRSTYLRRPEAYSPGLTTRCLMAVASHYSGGSAERAFIGTSWGAASLCVSLASMIADSSVTLGLAVGEGTGPELAAEFERVVLHLARLYEVKLGIERSPRLYQSYHSLMAGSAIEHASQFTLDDARHYEGYCRELAQAGVAAIFRTAMNAQSLYLVRQRLQAVKVERLSTEAVDLLLIRDQAQGFYTGDNTYDRSRGILARTCDFTRELTIRILEFSIEEARRCWGLGSIDRVVMAYKFHLLDGVFAAWVREWADRTGIEIELYQPDTTNRNLLRGGLGGRMLIIGSNEWADIMHVVLLHMLGREHQENRATRNVYLHAALNGLTEYQTVHGSADDIAGKGSVNPFATMRAAAAMMERHAACTGAERLMEVAVHRLTEAGVTTPDLGGRSPTSEVVAAALDCLSKESSGNARHIDGSEEADLGRDELASGNRHILVAS